MKISNGHWGKNTLIESLYIFYFKTYIVQYMLYLFTIVFISLYFYLNNILLNRNENMIILESTGIAFVVLISLPLVYVRHLLRKNSNIEHKNMVYIWKTESKTESRPRKKKTRYQIEANQNMARANT
jgi:hypothetical protein